MKKMIFVVALLGAANPLLANWTSGFKNNQVLSEKTSNTYGQEQQIFDSIENVKTNQHANFQRNKLLMKVVGLATGVVTFLSAPIVRFEGMSIGIQSQVALAQKSKAPSVGEVFIEALNYANDSFEDRNRTKLRIEEERTNRLLLNNLLNNNTPIPGQEQNQYNNGNFNSNQWQGNNGGSNVIIMNNQTYVLYQPGPNNLGALPPGTLNFQGKLYVPIATGSNNTQFPQGGNNFNGNNGTFVNSPNVQQHGYPNYNTNQGNGFQNQTGYSQYKTSQGAWSPSGEVYNPQDQFGGQQNNQNYNNTQLVNQTQNGQTFQQFQNQQFAPTGQNTQIQQQFQQRQPQQFQQRQPQQFQQRQPQQFQQRQPQQFQQVQPQQQQNLQFDPQQFQQVQPQQQQNLQFDPQQFQQIQPQQQQNLQFVNQPNNGVSFGGSINFSDSGNTPSVPYTPFALSNP